jgi:hypothetical protein
MVTEDLPLLLEDLYQKITLKAKCLPISAKSSRLQVISVAPASVVERTIRV